MKYIIIMLLLLAWFNYWNFQYWKQEVKERFTWELMEIHSNNETEYALYDSEKCRHYKKLNPETLEYEDKKYDCATPIKKYISSTWSTRYEWDYKEYYNTNY